MDQCLSHSPLQTVVGMCKRRLQSSHKWEFMTGLALQAGDIKTPNVCECSCKYRLWMQHKLQLCLFYPRIFILWWSQKLLLVLLVIKKQIFIGCYGSSGTIFCWNFPSSLPNLWISWTIVHSWSKLAPELLHRGAIFYINLQWLMISLPSLILQYFCQPPPLTPFTPCALPLHPRSTIFCIFIPISLPFCHYFPVNTSYCLYPRLWFLPPGGGSGFAYNSPYRHVRHPPSHSPPTPLTHPSFSPTLSLLLLFSAVDERRQLEETERNGPNYSIGNWKLAN